MGTNKGISAMQALKQGATAIWGTMLKNMVTSKLGFDKFISKNFLQDMPGFLAQGMWFLGGIFKNGLGALGTIFNGLGGGAGGFLSWVFGGGASGANTFVTGSAGGGGFGGIGSIFSGISNFVRAIPILGNLLGIGQTLVGTYGSVGGLASFLSGSTPGMLSGITFASGPWGAPFLASGTAVGQGVNLAGGGTAAGGAAAGASGAAAGVTGAVAGAIMAADHAARFHGRSPEKLAGEGVRNAGDKPLPLCYVVSQVPARTRLRRF